jgi:sugar phosphate isomerase/epimerase
MKLTKPLLSISTSFDYSVPIAEQIPAIARAGFTHVSLGMNPDHAGLFSAAGRGLLSSLLRQNNLAIDTIHGPQMDLPESIERITAIAQLSPEFGNPVIVVHPCEFHLRESELPTRMETVLKSIDPLAALAEKHNLRLALENLLPGPAETLIAGVLERADPEHFGFCYDSSHDQIGGPKPFDLLSRWSERLFAVHLSDRVRDFVDHVPPGEGFIDWVGLSKILRKSSYSDPLLFEVMVAHSSRKETVPFLDLVYRKARWVHALIHEA